jgi:NitT/TauT family transport system substrate-binding protein
MELRHLIPTIAAAIVALSAASAFAEDVSIMIGGIEKQIYLPAVLAQRLGYFDAEGVNVTLLSEPAGVEAADEMLAGAVQGVIGFYDHNIDLQALGKYTESVVQLSRVPGEVELVSTQHPEIRSVADFKGKVIGVTGLGSSTDFLTKYLLLNAGVKLSEVTPLPVGAGDSLIAAMQHDQIQAAMTTEPTVSRLLKTGQARVLIDMRDDAGTTAALGGIYPAACLYMETSWVKTHKETTQKLVNAFVKTMHFIHLHSAEEIAALMPSDFYVGDRAMYVDALASGKAMFTEDGRMPEGGPENVLAVLSRIGSRVRDKPIDLAGTYTTEFVDAANAER